MTIAEYLKEYRKKRGISQQELAKIFGVAVMTVCRIEGGQNYLSPKVIDRLVDLMKWEDFVKLDANDPLVMKVRVAYFDKHPRQDFFKGILNSRIWFNNVCQAIDPVLLRNGYTVVEDHKRTKTSPDRLYYNEDTRKYWAIYTPDSDEQMRAYSDTLLNLTMALGYSHLISGTNIHKLSVVTILSADHKFFEEVTSHRPYELLCDFSILPLDTDGKLHTEIDLSLLGDGRGLFDMDSPDTDIRAREIERFSKWKRSLL